MLKWIKRLLMLAAAVVVAFLGLRERSAHKREEAEMQKALNAEARDSLTEADAHAAKANAHARRAAAIQEKARAKTERIKDRADEPFATTVDRINRRLAGRMRDD